ncbi:hypothetical protein ACMGDM_20170 [Sphingomonas sp. DT-51]|uniref:hypothetical protein n=1 Tax=Sphingomonas sp. DT-51 TaxID=3396165 RepID=UPI003F1A5086
MKSATPLVADELVECVSQGAAASCAQLLRLAARIWSEAVRNRSARTWAELANEAPDRLFALRSAALALNGL